MDGDGLGDARRIAWIDIARGVCILAVVVGHLGVPLFNRVVYVFHLPVFFLLSGYLLKPQAVDRAWLARKFRSLIVPYLATCSAVTAMDVFNVLALGGARTFEPVADVLATDLQRTLWASGDYVAFGAWSLTSRIGAVWFLPALLFSLLFAQLLLNRVERPKVRLGVAFALSFATNWMAQVVWLPFSILPAVFALPFVLVGYELRRRDLLEHLAHGHAWVALAAAFVAGVVLNVGQMRMVNACADHYLVAVPIALATSVLVLLASMRAGECRVLEWVGRNSVYFLCVHLFDLETMDGWHAIARAALGITHLGWEVNLTERMAFVFLGTFLVTRLRDHLCARHDRRSSLDSARFAGLSRTPFQRRQNH